MDFLRALAASLWPQRCRKRWYSDSSSLLVAAAFASGAIEFALFGYLEWLQFRTHMLAVAGHFSHSNEGTQTAALLVMVVSELFYPLSLLSIVLAFEGLTRAVAAVINGEIVPSLVVTLPMSLWDRFHRVDSR